MKIKLSRFIYRMKDVLHEIKWGFQRMFRGYDDPTLWGYTYNFFDVILPVLRFMKYDGNSYPCAFDDPEKWNVILGEMIDGFEHGKKLNDGDFPFYDKLHADKEYNSLSFDDHFGEGTKVDRLYERYGGFDQLNKERDEYSKKFDEAMKLFVKYFWDLWD